MRFDEFNPRRRYERDPNWLEQRFSLFDKYCRPSVSAQTFKDFEWIFLVNPEFPGWSADLEKRLPGKVAYITAPWDEFQPQVEDCLNQETWRDNWVTTIRLDSDDIITNDFLMKTREGVDKEILACTNGARVPFWASFPNGYMMKEDRAYPRCYPRNPFQTYTEFCAPVIKTVLYTHHMRARNSVLLGQDPAWIQVDHGGNIKNKVEEKNLVEYIDAAILRERFTWNAC